MAIVTLSRSFVVLSEIAGDRVVISRGPIDYSNTVFNGQDADTLVDLIPLLPSLDLQTLLAAGESLAATITKAEFEDAIPIAIRAQVMAAVSYQPPVLDGEGNVITPEQPGLTFKDPPPDETPENLALIRAQMLDDLHRWWDRHAGIVVPTGLVDPPQVKLPIERQYVSLNGVAAVVSLQNNTDCVVDLGGHSDLSITIPAAAVPAAFAAFRSQYQVIAAAWDTTYRAIADASSVAELLQITIPTI